MNYVAGYCVVNDVSERAFQIDGTGQWTKGKSCDSFGPIGPWVSRLTKCPTPKNSPCGWKSTASVTRTVQRKP